VITAGNGDDYIWGGLGDDLIIAGNGNNLISASFGNDVLIGGDGNDIIFAAEGDDLLFGGLGNNYLSGGEGKDTFSISAAGSAFTGLNNTISDFTIGSDNIQLVGLGISSFGQLSITQSGANALVSNSAGLSIATVLNTNSTQLAASSFSYALS
jgi:Ca2+-binding RTX toxin-like protein